MRQRLLVVLTVAVVTLGELATYCSAQISTFPHVENFESTPIGVLPSGWNSTRNVSGDTTDFKVAATNPHSGLRAVGSTNGRITQSLTSPLFDFSSSTPDSLVFWYLRSTTHTSVLLVEASLGDDSVYAIQLSDSLRKDTTIYVRVSLPLPAILTTSNAVRFRWRIIATPTAGATATLRIDDIVISVRTVNDLSLSAVRFQPPAPVEGDSVLAFTKITNVGLQSAQNFLTEFFVDANNDSIPQPSELRATVHSTAPLPVSDSVEVNADLGVFVAGVHRVIVRLVYPPDQNLSNNLAHSAVSVGYPAHSLVINEIMYAPTSPEPEWIEIFNTRSDSVSVQHWMIADSNRVLRQITSQELKVPPSGYAVLTGSPSAFINIHPNVAATVIGVTSFPSLNNGGDAVMLYDERRALMDSVRYLSSWGGNSGGRSLERLDPFGSSTSSSNWGTSRSTNRSTPGERNSLTRKDKDLVVDSLQLLPPFPIVDDSVSVVIPVRNVGKDTVASFIVRLYEDANADSIPQPGELIGVVVHSIPMAPMDSMSFYLSAGIIVSNKFVIARVDFPADEDSSNNIQFRLILAGYPAGSVRVNEIMYAPAGTEPEWIELINTRSDSINLRNWLISDNVVTSRRIITDRNVILPPNSYTVLAKDSAALVDLHSNIPVRVLHVSNLPTLNNSADAVVVYDNREVTMDSVEYTASWGGGGGTSLERIDPYGSSTVSANWGSSRNPARSTPGTINSLARKDRDIALDSLRIFPPFPIVGDSVLITVHLRNPGREACSLFTVQLFEDVNGDTIPQPSELIRSLTVSTPLLPLDSTEVVFNIGAVQAGDHFVVGRVTFPSDEDTTNNTRRVRFGVGYPSGSVRINEIMYAPVSGIPEWIELISIRSDTIDLSKWQLGNRSSSSRYEIATAGVSLLPGEHLVVTKDTALLRAAYPLEGFRVVQTSSFPTFLWNNGGDAVVLSDNRKAVVDSLFYRSTWGGTEGRSLERIDPLDPSTDSTNWATSTDSLGGTPARRNSQVRLEHDLRAVRMVADTALPGTNAHLQVIVTNAGKNPAGQFTLLLFDDVDGDSLGGPAERFHQLTVTQPLAPGDSVKVPVEWVRPASGIHRVIALIDYPQDERPTNNIVFVAVRVGYADRTLVINEIMYSPFAGNAEYIEFYNTSQSDVDVASWRWHDRTTSGGTSNVFKLAESSKIIHPGEYFVLASDSSIIQRLYTGSESRLLTILNQPSLSLNNDGDDIVLIDPSGFLIDSVTYSAAWHNTHVADKTGRSLERLNPSLPSNDRRNWTTCAQLAGGTPGKQNSVFTITLPVRSKLSASPNPFSPDGDGREDFTIIGYELPLTVSTVRIRIYDVVGRRIRTLANNEPSGARGNIVWDGLDDEKQKARIGMYIVLLEAIDDAGGIVETAKTVVVLAAQLR